MEEEREWIKAAIDWEPDEEVIRQIFQILKKRAQDLQEEQERMIREGLDDIANGRVMTTEEVLREIESWRGED